MVILFFLQTIFILKSLILYNCNYFKYYTRIILTHLYYQLIYVRTYSIKILKCSIYLLFVNKINFQIYNTTFL